MTDKQPAPGLQFVGHLRGASGADNPAFLFVCPICRCEYVHIVGVGTKQGGATGYATGTGVKGDVITLTFFGECGSEFELNYGSHKGYTFVWKDVIKSCRVNYHAYIQSNEWKEKATAAKERAGWRCQVCNRSASEITLDAHHRTYENLGHEEPDDITVLCRNCHELFETHKRKERARRYQGEGKQ